MERVNDTFLLVGRLLMASLFLAVGIPHALQGYGGGFAKYLASLGMPYPEIMAVVGTAIEVLGGIALVLGVLPRISALLLIAFLIVAAGLAHRYWEFPDAQQQMNQMNHFLKVIALVGGMLFYYVSGPGAWSLAGRSAGAGAAHPARA